MKWSTAGWLTLVLAIVGLMVANSSEFFFHQGFYEIDDWAADSLSIFRAKHFAEFYGNYSWWGFHHPGPAFFYLQGFGEWLFFDRLHLVAAPFNGQLLIHLVFMTGLFVAVLAVFTRWLPPGRVAWFLPAALCLSALHFASMANLAPDLSYTLQAPSALASPWSAHALVIPTLCLLTFGASVATGRGGHLPLLAFVDGCLIHTHVAQPLFVLPLTSLAYFGLWWQVRREKSAPWRVFPRAHRAAVLILAIFAAPIVADLFRGSDSNLAAILKHLHEHHGEHKPLARSFFYFLQFGTYTEYSPVPRNDFGHYDYPGAMAYLRHYALYYVMWSAVVLLALAPLARALVTRRKLPPPPAPDAPAAPATPDTPATLPATPDTARFLAWAGVFLIADFALTLFWGTIQDGLMTYFNAWFNFAIYQFTALLALAALCARPPSEKSSPWLPALLGAGAVAAACLLLADPLRVNDPMVEADEDIHAAVVRAVKDSAPADAHGQPIPKLLTFERTLWPVAAGIALQLERAGERFVVPENLTFLFGKEHRWEPGSLPVQLYHAYSPREKAVGVSPVFALRKGGLALTITPPGIDPAQPERAEIDFTRTGNAAAYELGGMSFAEAWGSWNDGRRVTLAFHPEPAAGSDVAVSMDVAPLLFPPRKLTKQRMRMFFNGEQLGPEHWITHPLKNLTFTIPAALWADAARRPASDVALLEMEFPDVARPAVIDPHAVAKDERDLAMAFGHMHFRPVPPAGEPPE